MYMYMRLGMYASILWSVLSQNNNITYHSYKQQEKEQMLYSDLQQNI